MNIYIIHQYGEPEHFRSLSALKASSSKPIKLFFGDFFWRKDILAGVKKADYRRIQKGICSIFTFIRSILDRNGVIIWALAPGRKEISFIAKHYSKRKLIYFTSASEWDWNAPLLKAVNKDTKRQWDELLKISHVVHVNSISARLLQQYHTCKKVTVIPHSIETNIYNTQKRSEPDLEILHVLYVGRIIAQKGIADIYGVPGNW